MGHPLHLNMDDIQIDRTTYDWWYNYDHQLFCLPGDMVNPDIGIVAGSVPAFCGEVSGSQNEATTLDRHDQVSEC